MLVDNVDGDSVHLHKLLGELKFHFCLEYTVPAAKRVGAELLEFIVPESAEVVSGRQIFKTTAKNVGRQTMTKLLGSGSRKKYASKIIPPKSSKQISWSRKNILKHFFLINHVE